jgi:SAM-dependent methyltransferase
MTNSKYPPKHENGNGAYPAMTPSILQERLRKRGGTHLKFLRCPVDGGELVTEGGRLVCQQNAAHNYPLEQGVYRLVTAEQAVQFEKEALKSDQTLQGQGWLPPNVDSFRQLPQTGLEGWPVTYWQRRANVVAEFWRVLETARRDAEMLPIGSMGYALDISDGMGWFAYCLDVSGFNTIGLSQYVGPYNMTAYPYARYLRVQASIQKLPFEKGAFDLVVFSFSLHRVENPAQVLQQAAALLQPGAHLVVMHDVVENGDELVSLSETVMREAGLEVERRRVAPMGSPVTKLTQTLRRAGTDSPPLVVGRRITR